MSIFILRVFIYLNVCLVFADISPGDVRLAGGESDNEGRVEIYHQNQWGTICDPGLTWNRSAAEVVCRQLGYINPVAVVLTQWLQRYFAPGNGTLWLSDVQCTGHESGLTDCQHSIFHNISGRYGTFTCNHHLEVGAMCFNGSDYKPPIKVNFYHDVNNTANQGVIELTLYNRSGSVCSKSFGKQEATVMCRMLGFHGGGIAVKKGMFHYHYSHDRMWLDNLSCQGNETSILDCNYDALGGAYGCGQAAVYCWNGALPSTQIQLVAGADRNQGIVKLNFNGEWGTICNESLGYAEATVICRMVGFYGGGQPINTSRYHIFNAQMVLNDLSCRGDESSIIQCGQSGVKGCQYGSYYQAGVNCMSASDIRLVNGSRESEGRVEVYYNGTWGMVGQTSFDKKAAIVVCRMLGYSGLHSRAHVRNYYGEGSGPIWFDDVKCNGNESSLFMCPATPWGQTKVNLVAGVDCESNFQPKTLIRLSGGGNNFEGRVEVFHDKQWGTISTGILNFNEKEAQVVCNQLGINSAFAMPAPVGKFGRGTGPVWLDYISCMGTETEIDECELSPWTSDYNRYHSNDVGVMCLQPNTLYNFIRLTGGRRSSEGRVELWYNGKWGTICSQHFNANAASVVCQTLGYSGYLAQAKQRLAFGKGNGTIWLDNLSCNGSESDIYKCNRSHWVKYQHLLDYHCSDHYGDVGVNCEPWSEVALGIRLVDGSNRRMGRVEVNYNGNWSTVCAKMWYDWDVKEATVACNQLGFRRSMAVPIDGAYFGQGTGTVLLNGLECNGTETNIGFCNKNPLRDNKCTHSTDAGLMCLPKYTISKDTVRVRIPTYMQNGALVQVQFRGYWGAICSNDYSINIAKVICRQVKNQGNNWPSSDSQDLVDNTGPIWMDHVHCNGNETSIADCAFDGWGNHTCTHNAVVRLRCYDSKYSETFLKRPLNNRQNKDLYDKQ